MKTFLLAITALVSPVVAQTVLVKPYVQPGNGVFLEGADVKVLTWVTDQVPGEFKVEYNPVGQPARDATVSRLKLDFSTVRARSGAKGPVAKAPDPKEPALTLDEIKNFVTKTTSPPIADKGQHYFRYRSELPDLPFDTEVSYRVTFRNALVREGTFKTRASSGKAIRFVAVGDLANGKAEQNRIAYQISLRKPDFLVALGDVVYSAGLVSQYMHHFWPTYNDAPRPGDKLGAPLMASIPFYPVIGNHDADQGRLPDYPDAFGIYYFFSVPKNGPGVGAWNTPLGRDPNVAAAFREAAGAEYPALAVYSFDYGPAHFLCLDTNAYASPEALQPWIEKDLLASRQPWKFVCTHAPAFHTSPQHYSEQKLRLLQPTFEKCGVDVVFSGHVHNYQRSKPLRFKPAEGKRDPRGKVNGTFVLDQSFDGVNDTTPEGVIHIVSGGGGASLYKMDFAKTVASLMKDQGANYQPFTAKFNADRHSFSLVEVTPDTFDLRQIALGGAEIDHFRITKAAK